MIQQMQEHPVAGESNEGIAKDGKEMRAKAATAFPQRPSRNLPVLCVSFFVFALASGRMAGGMLDVQVLAAVEASPGACGCLFTLRTGVLSPEYFLPGEICRAGLRVNL